MKQMYLGIVRDAKNVTVHAVHFSACSDKEAEKIVALYAEEDRVHNGILEEQRVKKYKLPFRFNVGLKTIIHGE